MKTILCTVASAAALIILNGCDSEYAVSDYREHRDNATYIGLGGHTTYQERTYHTAYPGDRAYLSDTPRTYRNYGNVYQDTGY